MKSDALSLLGEWFQWWQDADEAPVKMPNALHVRTSMTLLEAGMLDQNLDVVGAGESEISEGVIDGATVVSHNHEKGCPACAWDAKHGSIEPPDELVEQWDSRAAQKMANCSCAHIKIGSEVTESKNWNPDCLEHGVESVWWNSPERVAKRAVDSTRLRDLQQQAKEARATKKV